jgi:deoxyribodipyrimidine photolyase-related protein
MMNIGLLTDKLIMNKVISYETKIQNLEGFIRQIFWRNYMMVIYMIENPIIKIDKYNSTIYHKLWNGETNIHPIDSMIKNYIIPYAYSHHITRLMYFSNFFKLCLLEDTLIYRWFMEVYIDAYNWVMFGNVYGMALNRIKIMTKNYIASSNYITKMSDFKDIDNWKKIFDSLYYNFINVNYKELKNDYSIRFQLAHWKTKKNKQEILKIANDYIHNLSYK